MTPRSSHRARRFGINNLINRMTGHGEEASSPVATAHAQLLGRAAAEPHPGP